jgi:hypothetical protein
MDTVEQFDNDRMFFIKTALLAKLNLQMSIVDTNEAALAGAKSAECKLSGLIEMQPRVIHGHELKPIIVIG